MLLLGCVEERVAPTRGQVSAFAEQFLLGQEWDWGPIERYWEPTEDGGRHGRYWQIDFHGPVSSGHAPILLVDAETGWVRLPPADYRRRVDIRPATTPARPAVVIAPGSWIHVLAEVEDTATAREQVQRLNERALADGLAPLFVVRAPRQGPPQLVYGWDGASGILRDGTVSAWLRQLGSWPQARWVDLAEWAGRTAMVHIWVLVPGAAH